MDEPSGEQARRPNSEEIGGKEDENTQDNSQLLYGIDEKPAWYICLLLGFQQYMTMLGSTIAVPLALTAKLGLNQDNADVGSLISTVIFVSGIATFLQSLFGVRLPIVQGPSFAILVPVLGLITNEEGVDWKQNMKQIQGAIILASLVEMGLAATGVIGVLLRFVTPLTIAPTITMIGMALFKVAGEKAATNWPTALITIALVALFSQYLRNFTIPIRMPNRGTIRFPLFKLFPIILSMMLVWSGCAVLTVSGALAANSTIRTDYTQALSNAAWFRVPYPMQWGLPVFDASAFLAMLAAVLASVIESVGDYYACARISGAPPPPLHAMNRGIFVEGFGCMVAGLFGTGNGTTSFSENVGAIGLSKVASRRVIQWTSLILLVLGVVGKFGALFQMLPEPLIGGLFVTMFGMITSVCLSSLHQIDLNSSRNLFVLGISIMLAMVIPNHFSANPLETQYQMLNRIVNVLMRTNMFVACVVACFLDNTIPGTREERGVISLEAGQGTTSSGGSLYDIPWITPKLHQWRWCRYVPILPPYTGNISLPMACKCRSNKRHANHQMENINSGHV